MKRLFYCKAYGFLLSQLYGREVSVCDPEIRGGGVEFLGVLPFGLTNDPNRLRTIPSHIRDVMLKARRAVCQFCAATLLLCLKSA
jgi:hypothetical protein